MEMGKSTVDLKGSLAERKQGDSKSILCGLTMELDCELKVECLQV